MAKKKTATQLVQARLGKQGKTTAKIAEQTELAPTTVGTILSALVKAGTAQIVGRKQAGGVGRPSNLYALKG